MLLLKNESLNKKSYHSLILYLFEKCETISFLVPDFDYAIGIDYEAKIKQFMEEIQPYIITNYQSDEYCGSITADIYNIYHVSFHYNIIDFLYAGLHLYKWIYPNLPEDLCFYQNGECYLKSIAHEKSCWIYTEDAKDISKLNKLGLEFTILPNEQAPQL